MLVLYHWQRIHHQYIHVVVRLESYSEFRVLLLHLTVSFFYCSISFTYILLSCIDKMDSKIRKAFYLNQKTLDWLSLFSYSLPSLSEILILPVPCVHSQNSCNNILLERQRRPHRTKPPERHMNCILMA